MTKLQVKSTFLDVAVALIGDDVVVAISTNMVPQRRTRPTLQPGDIFTLEIPKGRFWFGQVVSLQAGPMPGGSILVYIYDYSSDMPLPDASKMCLDRLLIPPCFINRMAWTRGFFLNVTHEELAASDLPKQFCFVSYQYDPSRLVDLHGRPVLERVEPVGHFALNSFASLDDELSDALGIPRAEVVQ